MRYKSRTQQQQAFRPTVVVLANSIQPIWYISSAYDTTCPAFHISYENVELDFEKAFDKCKKMAKGQYQQVYWIVDIEPLLDIEQNKGNGRDATVARIADMIEEIKVWPKVQMIINNPTFDVWLHLHFAGFEANDETTGDILREALEVFVAGYSRELSFYKGKENIYLKTKDLLPEAIDRADGLMEPDFPNLRFVRTMMPLVMSIFV